MYLSENKTMLAHRRYVVSFRLTNPAYEQARERTILVSAAGSANTYASCPESIECM